MSCSYSKLEGGLRRVLKDFISKQRSLDGRPGLQFLVLGICWNILNLMRQKRPFPIIRFVRANRLFSERNSNPKEEAVQIELLFVVAGTDMKILPYSVSCAEKALSNFIQPIRISVIVPNLEVDSCRAMFQESKNLEIINEDDLLSEDSRSALKKRFGERYGWVLQQLLKIQFVLGARSDGVLIVDADTLLLRQRPWLDTDSVQILTPSDEFNESYYDYLFHFDVCSRNPRYTFVSHHMLLQPKYLKEMISFTKWNDVDGIIKSLVSYPFKNMESPFSIDYEAYAQYLSNRHPSAVKLTKWANLAVPRSSNLENQIPGLLEKYDGVYSSISLHAYLR
jgi:hypothetical protein